MNRAPGIGTRGPAARSREETVLSVAATPDRVITRHARRIRLHHVLTRRRRWSKELDKLLSPAPDPWVFYGPPGGEL